MGNVYNSLPQAAVKADGSAGLTRN